MPGLELGPLGTHPSLPPPPVPGRGCQAPTFFADLHLVREFLVLGQFLGQRGQKPAKGRGPLPPAAPTPRSPPPAPGRAARTPSGAPGSGPQASPESASRYVHSLPPRPRGSARRPSRSPPSGTEVRDPPLPSRRQGALDQAYAPGPDSRGAPLAGAGGVVDARGDALGAAPLHPPGARGVPGEGGAGRG